MTELFLGFQNRYEAKTAQLRGRKRDEIRGRFFFAPEKGAVFFPSFCHCDRTETETQGNVDRGMSDVIYG